MHTERKPINCSLELWPIHVLHFAGTANICFNYGVAKTKKLNVL